MGRRHWVGIYNGYNILNLLTMKKDSFTTTLNE